MEEQKKIEHKKTHERTCETLSTRNPQRNNNNECADKGCVWSVVMSK